MKHAAIGILGPGAVGHMLAFFCNQMQGIEVHMRGRDGVVSTPRPVQFQGAVHTLRVSMAKPQLWLACLKAYALDEGLRNLLQRAEPGTQVIVFSNGYIEPIMRPLRHDFPDMVLRKGIVTRGIRAATDGTYIIGSQGRIIWGDERPLLPLESRIFKELGGYGLQWDPGCCRLRREKWYFNTCLNTLCGVRRYARNGQALEEGRGDLEILSHEALALGREFWPDWQPSRDDLWRRLLQLIADTADNENSMAADLRLGRRTEAAYLSGLVHEAKTPGAYPLLLALDRQLQTGR